MTALAIAAIVVALGILAVIVLVKIDRTTDTLDRIFSESLDQVDPQDNENVIDLIRYRASK